MEGMQIGGNAGEVVALPAGAGAFADLLLAGGGQVGALMRAMDWSATRLGVPDRWPQSLRTTVSTCLNSRFPILVWWGPDLVMLYNDAYVALIGAKHPYALGRSGREVFPEIWDIIGPMLGGVLTLGEATWSEDQLLLLERHGFPEECYFTFSYSPIRAENGGVGGVFTAVTETTPRVIGERRLATLRGMAERAAVTRSRVDAIRGSLEGLAGNAADVPFALLYLLDEAGDAVLAGTTGDGDGSLEPPRLVSALGDGEADSHRAAWPVREVAATGERLLVLRVPGVVAGQWPGGARQAVSLPVVRGGQERPYGVLVAGVGCRLPLDDGYLGFLDLLAGQVATALSNAEAYELERERAEALAELDRAKTAFFSNVSHEFRTPLTLLLGPAEELLGDPQVDQGTRDRAELIHRNAQRLQRLVNTLLEFTRIEAGRVEARFEPLDLSTLTADLASTFRSAVERAGLILVVDCPPLPEPVYVDRDMWEKVVLNLLSNALKHTFLGVIAVDLSSVGGEAVLTVSDTGVGIPAGELPRIFDRFHRVPNARARSHEGSGIGLSLAQEMVRLHGGEISVHSEEGRGSTFTVRLPLGAAHLPQDRILPAGSGPRAEGGAAPFVEEALRWLPGTAPTGGVLQEQPVPAMPDASVGARILLADDNADMRAYVERLLREQGWRVEAVSDGDMALRAARAAPPDLVLADVMMPGLGGFELLRALRQDDATGLVPVILLSARAGEESRIEGLHGGADDYLVKPFAARELVARIRAHLRLAAARARATAEVQAAHAALRAAHERLQEEARATQAALAEAETARRAAEAANRAKSEFLAAMSHDLRTPLNAIAGYAQIMELGVNGPITDDQRESLQRIQRSERHLLSLINDVLNFTKIEAGRLEYELRDVRLADAVDAVRQMVEPQLGNKRLSLEMHVPAEISVRADEEKLRQILLNLLSNALKFTEAGGRVSVDVAWRAGAPPEAVFLRVSDTGIGIPREKQEVVFDPFVQVSRGLTRSVEGSGLGLAISRQLARGMGGDLRVRSQEGAGSTFTVTLPRSGGRQGPEESARSAA